MRIPAQDQIRGALAGALDELQSRDAHLLDANCSERSVTHQLAVHIARFFPNHHVDCEYNRDGFDIKRLQLAERTAPVADDALDAVTVFPDIVVHIRGHSHENILVIEVKKASSAVDHAYDIAKLHAFKAQLGYQQAAHVVIGLRADGSVLREVTWM